VIYLLNVQQGEKKPQQKLQVPGRIHRGKIILDICIGYGPRPSNGIDQQHNFLNIFKVTANSSFY